MDYLKRGPERRVKDIYARADHNAQYRHMLENEVRRLRGLLASEPTDCDLADYLEQSATDVQEFGQSSAAYRMRLAAHRLREYSNPAAGFDREFKRRVLALLSSYKVSEELRSGKPIPTSSNLADVVERLNEDLAENE